MMCRHMFAEANKFIHRTNDSRAPGIFCRRCGLVRELKINTGRFEHD